MPKIDFEKERKSLDREITYFHFGRAQRKINKCIHLARKDKDKFFLYYFQAQDHILNERFSKGLKYIEKALLLRADDGCSYNDKALCYAELGRNKDALSYFNKGLRKDRNCACLFHNKGWLLNLLGEHKKAIVCFYKALELNDRLPEALYSAADSYLKLGQNKKAAYYFNKALKQIKGKSSLVRRNILNRLKSL
jgi:tetratricopeptide (TPR) repeat protein|tara:strand:- start:1594 stop:2175 length:582 start_codon:yes stop_codon:yes gene_type:complete